MQHTQGTLPIAAYHPKAGLVQLADVLGESEANPVEIWYATNQFLLEGANTEEPIQVKQDNHVVLSPQGVTITITKKFVVNEEQSVIQPEKDGEMIP